MLRGNASREVERASCPNRIWEHSCPITLGAHVDAQLLGPNPVALQRQNGPVYKVNTFKLGEGTHVSRYFTFRHYGTVGSSGQS